MQHLWVSFLFLLLFFSLCDLVSAHWAYTGQPSLSRSQMFHSALWWRAGGCRTTGDRGFQERSRLGGRQKLFQRHERRHIHRNENIYPEILSQWFSLDVILFISFHLLPVRWVIKTAHLCLVLRSSWSSLKWFVPLPSQFLFTGLNARVHVTVVCLWNRRQLM